MDDKIKVKIVGIASALFFAAIVANFIPDSADVPLINKIAHSDSIKIYKTNFVDQSKEIYDILTEKSLKMKSNVIKSNKFSTTSDSDSITSINWIYEHLKTRVIYFLKYLSRIIFFNLPK